MVEKHDILIIDDDRDLVYSMRTVLASRHYTVRTAQNTSEGLKEIAESIPDLIILDVMMRTMTEGLDFALRLRNQQIYKDIPILMITSFVQKMEETGTEPFQHILGEEWPVTYFMEKPVDPDVLLTTVAQLLREE